MVQGELGFENCFYFDLKTNEHRLSLLILPKKKRVLFNICFEILQNFLLNRLFSFLTKQMNIVGSPCRS